MFDLLYRVHAGSRLLPEKLNYVVDTLKRLLKSPRTVRCEQIPLSLWQSVTLMIGNMFH